MSVTIGSYALSAAAGALSTLSPCVLPLVPVLMASATSAHRRGPLALAAGVAVSFALAGTLLAAVGTALGVDAERVRSVGATLMLAVGVVLCSGRLQRAFATATAGLSRHGEALAQRIPSTGVAGQFALGAVLGIVWTPCAGPTLGAAVTLASQRHDLPEVAALMACYGIGASVPLLVIGSLSRAAWSRSRGALRGVGVHGRLAFGIVLVALSLVMLTGTDRVAESWFLDHAPAPLVALVTRF